MTVKNGGNVGIGTSSPLAKLSVGNGSLSDSNLPVQISTAAASGTAYFGANKNGAYGALFGFDNAGYAGVVVRNVVSAGASGDAISFVVNNTTTAVYIKSDGNVGIGTTSPTQKLEVNGTIKATSFVGSFYKTSTTQTITGNSALTIDVSAAYIHIITVAASGGVFGISSVTYNNRKADPEVDEIILIFKWPASGSGSINISNTIGDIPFNYGKATVSRLTSYKGTTGLWIAETVASNIDYTNL
jgi:hypothetical protein